MSDRTRTLRTALAVAVVAIAGCGGGDETTLPDESGDLTVGSEASMARHLEGTTPAGPDLAGTTWRWVESHCTEGPLELAARGFEQRMSLGVDAAGFLITYDHRFAGEGCTQTIVQRATPGATPEDSWAMSTEAHLSLPPDCGLRPEPDRPGDVRRRGDFLEIYVQRSNWCNGLEVRHVYARDHSGASSDEIIVRHFLAHFSRRDAGGLASLFAETGSLVEPFTESATGTTRHEGRAAVHAWYAEALSVPWVALRLTSLEVQEGGRVAAGWEYMDPRIAAPVAGRNAFTIAAGEIFEASIELTGQPVPAPTPTPGGGEDASGADADASGEGGGGEGGAPTSTPPPADGDPEAGDI